MDEHELRKYFPNASVSTRARNRSDAVIVSSPSVGAAQAGDAEPAPARALERRAPQRRQRKGRVAVVVTLTALRHRELDDDNLAGACKALRDAIAATLGLDDGDRRLRFEYGQIVTRGEEGVLVKIEKLNNAA